MATKTRRAKKQKTKPYYAVIGTEGYGLYYGIVDQPDSEIVATGSVRVRECRHVRYWYGGTGGITSLALWGPCGPDAHKTRIGAPDESSLLTHVRAVHSCSADAVAAFARIEATHG